MTELRKYLSLVFSFFKIGLFTFGGGYAMISLIEREFVDKRKWIEYEEFSDVVAIAESTPGPIAVNMATYIGYKTRGYLGAALSTAAVCLPSFVIIYIVSLFFDAFLAAEYVGYAFRGIQVCVAYLIISAGVRMLKKMKKSRLNLLLLCLSGGAMVMATILAVKLSSIMLILLGAVAGVGAYFVGAVKRSREGGRE